MTVLVSRYAIHLWDMNHEGVWENRAIYVYYAELIFELATLSIDFCHHLHMLVRLFLTCCLVDVKIHLHMLVRLFLTFCLVDVKIHLHVLETVACVDVNSYLLSLWFHSPSAVWGNVWNCTGKMAQITPNSYIFHRIITSRSSVALCR